MDETRLIDVLMDPETSLLRRTYFEMRFDEEFKKAWRYGWPLAYVMVELSGLSALRRAQGDRSYRHTLLGVSGELLRNARDTDLSTRLDDELFGLLLPGATASGVASFRDRVLSALEQLGYGALHPAIGVAIAPADDLPSADEFRARAEEALERARGQPGGGLRYVQL